MKKSYDDDDEEDMELKQFKVLALLGKCVHRVTLIVQVILLGDGAVGKTSIANR